MQPVMIPTESICSHIPCIPGSPEPSLPLCVHIEYRSKPKFSICEAHQCWRNLEPQEACNPWKKSCQCMERVECTQKMDEPEWLASAPTDNEWLGAESMTVTILGWDKMTWSEKISSKHPASAFRYVVVFCTTSKGSNLNWISFIVMSSLVFVKLSTLTWSVQKQVN